jgi:5-carboxymethyl-2-hydroxymuconate isomerase
MNNLAMQPKLHLSKTTVNRNMFSFGRFPVGHIRSTFLWSVLFKLFYTSTYDKGA